jgi:hypothetical protein
MRVPGSIVNRQLLVDAAVLTAVPVALVLLHAAVPIGTREQFYLRYHDPTIFNAFTAGFLHRSWGHLQGNLQIFALVIPAVYAIYWRWQRRRSFWIVFLAILTLTPLLSAGFGYVILHARHGGSGTTAGFSGIANAYAGMLLAITGFYVAHRTSRWVGFGLVFTAYLMGSWVILDNFGGLTLIPTILLLSGMMVGVYLAVSEFEFEDFNEMRDALKSPALDTGLISYALLIFTVSIAAGFPEGAGEGGVNIVAHMVGVVFGFLVAGLVWWRRGRSLTFP